MEIKSYPLSELILNENNPRFIKDGKFDKLVQSIKEFPEMLKLRPIVVDIEMQILGGNMRYNAAKEIGLEEIPVMVFTEEMYKRANAERMAMGHSSKTYKDFCDEFLIKDNVSFGEWDWDIIANAFDSKTLEDWGLNLPVWDFGNINSAEDIKTNNQEYKDTDGFAMDYLNSDIKKFEIFVTKEQYQPFIDALIKIKENTETENNSDAIIKLVMQYGK